MGNIHIGHRSRPRLLLLGFESSGKTALLFRLTHAAFLRTVPTIALSVNTLSVSQGLDVRLWDVGGLQRNMWDVWLESVDMVVMVIDAAHPHRIAEARDEIARFVEEDLLGKSDTPFLVCANKQDLPGALSAADVSLRLGLGEIMGTRPWTVLGVSALTGAGVDGILTWLRMTIKSRPHIGSNHKRRFFSRHNHHHHHSNSSSTNTSTSGASTGSHSNTSSGMSATVTPPNSSYDSTHRLSHGGRVSHGGRLSHGGGEPSLSRQTSAIAAIRAAEAADEAGVSDLPRSLSRRSRGSFGSFNGSFNSLSGLTAAGISVHPTTPHTSGSGSVQGVAVEAALARSLSSERVSPLTTHSLHHSSHHSHLSSSRVGGGVDHSGLSLSPEPSSTPASSQQHSPTSPARDVAGLRIARPMVSNLTVDISSSPRVFGAHPRSAIVAATVTATPSSSSAASAAEGVGATSNKGSRFSGPTLQPNLIPNYPTASSSEGGTHPNSASPGSDDAMLDSFLNHAIVHNNANNLSSEHSPSSSRGRLPSVFEDEELHCDADGDSGSAAPMSVFFRTAAKAQQQQVVSGTWSPHPQKPGSSSSSSGNNASLVGGSGGGYGVNGMHDDSDAEDSDDEGGEGGRDDEDYEDEGDYRSEDGSDSGSENEDDEDEEDEDASDDEDYDEDHHHHLHHQQQAATHSGSNSNSNSNSGAPVALPPPYSANINGRARSPYIINNNNGGSSVSRSSDEEGEEEDENYHTTNNGSSNNNESDMDGSSTRRRKSSNTEGAGGGGGGSSASSILSPPSPLPSTIDIVNVSDASTAATPQQQEGVASVGCGRAVLAWGAGLGGSNSSSIGGGGAQLVM